MGKGFNYTEEFKKLDMEAIKKDLYGRSGKVHTGLRVCME